ncbi:hypothetical protein C8R43DRAFT_1005489 [Mycena crocata]|nr:hypothetical protein C8R43DRAFT_1005489 [Mycena crocata]
MPRSPPPPNPGIVNAGNLLPSVNVLFEEVSQRERASSHSSPGSRAQSAWMGFPGPDPALLGRTNPGTPNVPPPPLRIGPRAIPQAQFFYFLPSLNLVQTTERRHTVNNDYPHQSPVYVPAPAPVVPNRMGGRYAQTPCHSNGQPHAPGLMLGSQGPAGRQRQSRSSTSASGRHGPDAAPRDTPDQAAVRIFHELMAAAGSPSCPQCMHDLKVESRRQVSGSHGAVFSQFAHGLKPQHPTSLPAIKGLITIPFTPKPLGNQTLHGVSLTEILDFRDVLDDPRERVLDNSLNNIFITMELPGFPTVVKQISGNCPHRPVSRFNIAFSVAEAFFSYFKAHEFNPALVPPSTSAAVARSITQLRLVNLYTTDRTNYRAHLAFVF